ncbi:MAG: hypothetical protein WBC44_03730 [Planctomycetaceae bacterium]
MNEFVIDDQTVSVPIGELIRQAVEGGELVLLDSERRPIAWIRPAVSNELPPITPEELDEIRRRSRADRSTFITSDELLRRLNARSAGA